MAKLFYVTGPSGSGKDSVMSLIRVQQPESLLVAHRYITRPAHAGGENYIELTPEEFEVRKSMALFAMDWEANGFQYGIGAEVDDWLTKGINVMVNGSREYLPQALEKYGKQLVPVVIYVPEAVLAQRLRARGRENDAMIQQRLARAKAFLGACPQNSIVLDNSGSLRQTVNQFTQVAEQLI